MHLHRLVFHIKRHLFFVDFWLFWALLWTIFESLWPPFSCHWTNFGRTKSIARNHLVANKPSRRFQVSQQIYQRQLVARAISMLRRKSAALLLFCMCPKIYSTRGHWSLGFTTDFLFLAQWLVLVCRFMNYERYALSFQTSFPLPKHYAVPSSTPDFHARWHQCKRFWRYDLCFCGAGAFFVQRAWVFVPFCKGVGRWTTLEGPSRLHFVHFDIHALKNRPKYLPINHSVQTHPEDRSLCSDWKNDFKG